MAGKVTVCIHVDDEYRDGDARILRSASTTFSAVEVSPGVDLFFHNPEQMRFLSKQLSDGADGLEARIEREIARDIGSQGIRLVKDQSPDAP